METLEKIPKLRKVAEGLAGTYASHLPEGLSRRSTQAKAALDELEFPTTKVEEWKYTRTAQIANKAWKFSQDLELPGLPISLDDKPYRMVFINGHYAATHSSLPAYDGLILDAATGNRSHKNSSFDESTAHQTNAFNALNTAYPQDGFWLHLEKDVVVESPLYIINVYTGDQAVSQPRNYIHLERGAQMRITEYHIHLGATFANAVTEIVVDENTTLGIDSIQIGSAESFHMQQVDTRIARSANFTHNNFTLSGKWTRNDTNAQIQGTGVTANFHGLYMPSGNEHVDNHTVMDHEKPHCDSNELYRGVLMDQSTGVFNGKVFVRRDAQKTNAFQSNGNIVVSDTATMNSKPELEIYADDVKCSHGSTTGQLDDDAMFYLRTRGLSTDSARKMLVTAFMEDVLEKLVNPDVRPLIEEAIENKLSKKTI
jgi:Fe-S cluster assembly protein SufD